MKITGNKLRRAGLAWTIIAVLVLSQIIIPFESYSYAMGGTDVFLNEVEFDAPSDSSEACQYIELRGQSGTTIPAGTKFLSVNGGADNFGSVSTAVELNGLTFGSNGTITVVNEFEACANRNFPAGTTLVNVLIFGSLLGGGAESYLVVNTPLAISAGDDIDSNDDRVSDPARQITLIDGFAVTVNAQFEASYGPSLWDAATQGPVGSTELPDAATRFPGDTATLNAGAWYFGELAGSPDETTVYSGQPQSTNFPVGGALTPGEPNVPAATPTPTPTPTPATLQFSQANYTVSESGGSATITVTRTGDPGPVSVNYMTTDNSDPADFVLCTAAPAGTASSRCDFNTALGILRFANNELSKTFNVLITQDSYVEGNEQLQLVLSNPTGGAVLGPQSTATLQITDDANESATNPIDDARNFVRQQYHDFLNREPDAPGWDFWTDNITKCSDPARRPPGQTEQQCVSLQRDTTSAAFFLSPEFRYTGFYVFSVFTGSLGRMPNFVEFMRGTRQVANGIIIANQVSGPTIEENRAQYLSEFIQRAEFVAIYGALSNQQYVDKLFQTTGIAVSDADKQALVAGLGNGSETRASVLHKIVNGTRVISESQVEIIAAYGKAFGDTQFNPAFVQMEYLGYLRRNQDTPGFNHWLAKLNLFGDFLSAEMVRAFIISPEYRQRFGP